MEDHQSSSPTTRTGDSEVERRKKIEKISKKRARLQLQKTLLKTGPKAMSLTDAVRQRKDGGLRAGASGKGARRKAMDSVDVVEASAPDVQMQEEGAGVVADVEESGGQEKEDVDVMEVKESETQKRVRILETPKRVRVLETPKRAGTSRTPKHVSDSESPERDAASKTPERDGASETRKGGVEVALPDGVIAVRVREYVPLLLLCERY